MMHRIAALILLLVFFAAQTSWGQKVSQTVASIFSSITINGASSGSIAVIAPNVAGNNTLTLPAATDTLVAKNTVDNLANKTLTDPVIPAFVVSISSLTMTSNIAFQAVPNLAIPLTAGKTYQCHGHLVVTASAAAGGIQVEMANANTLSASSASFTASNWNGATINARSTAGLGAAIGASASQVTDVYVDGAIVVNAAGIVALAAAQQTSNPTSTVVGANSSLNCVRMN